MADFPAIPDLRFATVIDGSRTYILQEPLNHSRGTVPAGFATDGASVPRIFWPIITKDGDIFAAAIIHDHDYYYNGSPRRLIDKAFLANMQAAGVGWWKRRMVYRAVRLGGWIGWNTHRRRESQTP